MSEAARILANRPRREPPSWREDHCSQAAATSANAGLYAAYFGTFALFRDGRGLSLGRTRAVQALSRYLIARRGQVVSREELLELLWPNAGAERANHRLHVAVSSARRLVDMPGEGSSVIHFESDSYCVPQDAVLTDCDVFDGHYGRARHTLSAGDAGDAADEFRSALAVYAGEYLADMPYAEWTHVRRAHFALRRLNALTFLCDHSSLQQDLLATMDFALQILEVDNLRERAHRELMRAHYLMGQRGLAIRQFEACARILQQELGVAPSPITRRLHQAIRDESLLPEEARLRWNT